MSDVTQHPAEGNHKINVRYVLPASVYLYFCLCIYCMCVCVRVCVCVCVCVCACVCVCVCMCMCACGWGCISLLNYFFLMDMARGGKFCWWYMCSPFQIYNNLYRKVGLRADQLFHTKLSNKYGNNTFCNKTYLWQLEYQGGALPNKYANYANFSYSYSTVYNYRR